MQYVIMYLQYLEKRYGSSSPRKLASFLSVILYVSTRSFIYEFFTYLKH